MKTMLTTAFLLAMVLFLFAPSAAYATSDTLAVYATSPTNKTLDQVIGGDTTATGAQAHKVYKLVSTDTTYIFDQVITVKSDITVLGVLKANGRPPCIQPDVLKDGSVPAQLFILNGAGTKAIFRNLYLLGLSLNGTANDNGVAFQVSADNVKLYTDNVIFEEWHTFAIGYNGNWDSFFITNCRFRNMVSGAGQWYLGEVLRNMWPGAAYTDTVYMKNNTMFCVNAYSCGSVTKYYQRYFEFSHNNVIWSFKNPFFVFNVTNAKINDNIFYAAWSGGISKTEYPWWDELWSPEVGSIIDLDALDSAKAAIVAPGTPKNSTDIDTAAEKLRTIQLKNNAYYWPASITNLWKTWNDTAHVDSIYTPTWMNARTTKMFTDKKTWPGLVQSGNLNVDPTFGASINNVANNNAGNGVGFLKYFNLIRTGTIGTETWGYQNTVVGSAANWVPTWPLPEAVDMKYTNASLLTGATDGTQVGDPYWFKGGPSGVKDVAVKPIQFTLFDAYPNPFNPSTTVKFHLAQSGLVSLNVYNVMGQLVKTVVNNEYRNSGDFSYQISMDNMTSGVYFYTLTQGSSSMTKKFVLMK